MLDTTVPEPCALALVAGVLWLARRGARQRALLALLPVLCAAGAARHALAAPPVVSNVTALQRPGPLAIVDIHYDLHDADGDTQSVYVAVSTNSPPPFTRFYNIAATNFTGDYGTGVTTGQQKHIEWRAYADVAFPSSSTMRVRVMANDDAQPDQYMVIDVSLGPSATSYPVTYLSSQPVLSEEYRVSNILLRLIPAGTFVMGSPASELGRFADETSHTVTLTKAFYISVYEITQGQYLKVSGANPSYYKQGTHMLQRPVESVSWNDIRAGTWPNGNPNANTFIGRLRTRTGLACDLPTEAQWEYACRAGATNALHNDTNITNINSDANLALLGRYSGNGGASPAADPTNRAHTAVGSYQCNRWGLYDMHGNVDEWCLDWYASSLGNATDPTGPSSGAMRVIRGGGFSSLARKVRSAKRFYSEPDDQQNGGGFRLAIPAE
jgi:formylglycine-generating enzyme required for sulfatase activity